MEHEIKINQKSLRKLGYRLSNGYYRKGHLAIRRDFIKEDFLISDCLDRENQLSVLLEGNEKEWIPFEVLDDLSRRIIRNSFGYWEEKECKDGILFYNKKTKEIATEGIVSLEELSNILHYKSEIYFED